MTPVEHLLIDARPVDHPTARQRGIGRYVYGLLDGLLEIDAPFTALYATEAEREALLQLVPSAQLKPLAAERFDEYPGRGVWYLTTLLMHPVVGWDPVPALVTRSRMPIAAIMYDVIPYRNPERYFMNQATVVQSKTSASLAGTLDAMLAISAFAADSAAEILPIPRDRIAVIGTGVGDEFVPASEHRHPRPERVLPAGLGEYVIAVTGTDPRKNTDGLLRAWGLLGPAIRSQYRLVIACAVSPGVLAEWRAIATAAGVADEVVFTGAVSDDEMVALHQHASLSVMPSFDEGFGLPVIEAAACGIPAICSDVSSLPEVLDEPLACFAPGDPSAIAAKIDAALTNPLLRQTLIEAGQRASTRWRWPIIAADAVAALTQLGPRWSTPRTPLPYRLALVGAMRDHGPGIGVGNEAIAACLATHLAPSGRPVEVDVFVETTALLSPCGGGPGRYPARALGNAFATWEYHDMVVSLGSGRIEYAAIERAALLATHVWWHRVELGQAPFEIATFDEIAASAISMIVATVGAVEQLAQRIAVPPPILVAPRPFPAVGPRRTQPAVPSMICAAWAPPDKDPHLLIEVLAKVTAVLPEVTLTFIGRPASEDEVVAGAVERELLVAATAAGIDHLITFTGWLDDDAYRNALAAAHLAIVAPTLDSGAMSGSITDCLSVGTPALSTTAQLPDSAAFTHVTAPDRASLVDALATAALDLLQDETRWQQASDTAREIAAGWTIDDLAERLLAWYGEARRLEPGTVTLAGPAEVVGVGR